jgi:RHS repeat-associated protein
VPRRKLSRRVAGVVRLMLLAGVLLGALLVAPLAASATALPSVIKENTTLTAAGSPYTGETTIEPGATLTVEPGAGFTGIRIVVKGTLDAEGTSAEPITFAKATGRYQGIFFESGSGGVLDHVEVSESGNHEWGTAEVESRAAHPTIENSTFSSSASTAIHASEGGAPHIADNYVSGCGANSTGISYSASGKTPGEVDIHGNQVTNCPNGITVSASLDPEIVGTSLGENTITGSTGTALSAGGIPLPGDITSNTLTGNTSNLIVASGTVAHSETWANGGTLVEPNVAVSSGATLTIEPGLNFIHHQFNVKGTLDAEGTSAEPITFTKATGRYQGIFFESGSGASALNYVEVSESGNSTWGTPEVEARAAHPTIENSTFSSSASTAIRVAESGNPTIEWNRFRGDAKGGLSYSGTGKLNAPNNDWECASGPKPAGCGASVTSNVEWKPAVQLPEVAGHCRGEESQCPKGADPVSLATGQLDYSHQDLLLTNKSEEPVEFTRSYSSASSADTGLGPGWSQTGLASAIELESGKEVLVLRQDGRQDIFEKTESGYKAPSGVTDTLAKVEGTFQLTTLLGTVYRFDPSGRIVSITDSHGLKTTYAYSSEGRLATITDPSAQTLTFSYNGSNHITLVKDSTGREVKFAYTAAGDLETVTDALAGVTKYAYDAQHRLTSITDPRGNVILKNTYNGEGKITEQEDGLKNLWKLEYKTSETIVTEPQGGKLKYGFDGQDRVVSETDQLGHTTTTAYDEAGNVHEVIQPGGAKWVLGHDAAGNLTSIKDPEGGEREYEYNAQNRPISFTDARGNAWAYEWSKAGDLEKVSDPEGGETTFTYNESGQPLTKTDPDKHKTEFSYDARGNELSETDPLSHKTSFEYNSRNYLIAKTAPGLKAEKLERNALGDLLSRTTPEGHTTKYAYDKNGLPTQITDPGEDVWKIEYNTMERPTLYTDPLEGQTEISYNGNLNPTKVINRRGKETTYGYDLANQLTEVDRPEGEDWTYGYDSRGNRTSVIDPREHETAYEYDLLNRMTKASEPLEVTTEYGYDANGDLTSVKDPRGNTTEYGYDKLGRMVEVAQPLEKTTAYSYDAASNLLSKTTAAGTLEYEHDAANRLTAILAGETTLRSYGYDAATRRTSATDGEGDKIEIGYNEDSLPNSIKDWRGQSLTRVYNSRGELAEQVDGRGTLKYEYDKLGRLAALTDPQGKPLGFGYDPEGDLTEVTRPSGVTTTNVYNDAGRLAETISIKAGEPPVTLESLEYGYNAAGNVTSKIDQRVEAETTYSYDALNRLAEFNPPGEGATTYGYDKAGNRTEAGGVTSTFNALNQITEASDGSSYGYDGAGRLTSIAKGEEETTYGWDLLDHLATVEGPGGTASYAYDALERLSERKGSGGTLVFHYGDLSDMPTYAANGEGETTTSYVQGAHGMIEQRSGETTSYPLRDAHGDVTAIANEAGEVTSRQSYDPWGAQLSGASIEMGYLGAQQRRVDPTSGLIQMGARSYDPTLGSFMSEDPVLGQIGLGATSSRYPYVWDNPLRLYDLDGRFPSPGDIAGAVGGAANDAWNTGKEIVTHPGEAATNAVEYWAGSDSPASYVFGPLSVLGDMAINPDRAAYYLEKANPAQMAATGILVAGSAGLIVVTAEATADCLAVTAGIDAVHVCGQVAAMGGGLAAAGGVLAVEVAKR